MKKALLLTVFATLFISLSGTAQSLTISDIEKLVWMNSSDKQDFLISKGFDFWREKVLTISDEDVTNISYGKGQVSNGVAYHYSEVFSYFDRKQFDPLHNISYSIYSASHYLEIKKYIKLNYKLQLVGDVETYKKDKITIIFNSLRDELDKTRWIIGAFHDI